jgi:hypothetical protein
MIRYYWSKFLYSLCNTVSRDKRIRLTESVKSAG